MYDGIRIKSMYLLVQSAVTNVEPQRSGWCIVTLVWEKDLETVDKDAGLDEIGISDCRPVEPMQHLPVPRVEDEAAVKGQLGRVLDRIAARADQHPVTIERDPAPEAVRDSVIALPGLSRAKIGRAHV